MGIDRSSKDQIFNAAAELLDPVMRANYLDDACAEDPELRVEIEDLLGQIPPKTVFLIPRFPITL